MNYYIYAGKILAHKASSHTDAHDWCVDQSVAWACQGVNPPDYSVYYNRTGELVESFTNKVQS